MTDSQDRVRILVDEDGKVISEVPHQDQKDNSAFGTGMAPLRRLLARLWRSGMVIGVVMWVIGLALISSTSGLAALIAWPFAFLLLVVGSGLVWAAATTRRVTRNLK